MKSKVEIQKGPINASKPTSKMMTHDEKLREKSKENADRRDGQTLKEYSPKKGK